MTIATSDNGDTPANWKERIMAVGLPESAAVAAIAAAGADMRLALAELPPEEWGATWNDLSQLLGPIEWDWPGWIARGFQTLVGSKPGEGKSSLILRIAGCYLNGWDWPDESKFQAKRGDILWCETEAAQALNLERARKWGLPLDRIHTPLDNPLDDICLDNPEHQAAIVSVARHNDIRLIIVDSLSGGTRKDAKSSSDMMVVGSFMAGLARDTGIPVLATHHLRKKGFFDGDEVSLDMFRDSSAIVQTARIIWAIDAPDTEYNHQKRLYVVKSNLGKFPNRIGFEVDEKGLSFMDAPQPPKQETQLDRATDLLMTLLTKEPRAYSIIEKEAEGAAISINTMRRAKKKLGVNAVKNDAGWFWSLPSREDSSI